MANTKVTGDLIASSTIATGNIADNAVTSDKISGITTAHITEGANLYYTDARADARVALLVDSAPSTLNTLNELADALGDDPNYAATTAVTIGLKAPLASPSFTGNATFAGVVTASQALLDSGEKISWGTQGAVSIEGTTGSNQMEFRTGAGDRMIINNTGVGIGTDSPQRNLHVNGTEGVLRLTSTASGNNGFEVGIGVSSQAFLWLAENSHMEFATNNTERMRITSGGNVKINSSGSLLIRDDGTFIKEDQGLQIGNTSGTGTTRPIRFFTESTERMRIDSSGTTTITNGTNDNTLLLLNGARGRRLRIEEHNTGNGGIAITSQDDNETGTTNSNNRTILLNASGGNVGIGETSPSSYFSPDLVVKAKANLGGITIRSNATSDNNYLMFADGTSGNTQYRGYVNYNHSADSMTFGSAAVARLTIDSSGNVIIGNASVDNPNSLDKVLEIEHGGSVGLILNDSRDNPIGLENRGAVFHLTHNTNSRLVVNGASGNVGIGTTSPQTKLQTNLTITGSYLSYLNGTSATFDAQPNIAAVHNSPSIGNATAAGLMLVNNDKSNGAPSPIIAFSAKSESNNYNHTYAAIYGIRTAGGADINWAKGDIVLATGSGTGPNERMRVTSGGRVEVAGNVLSIDNVDEYRQDFTTTGSSTPSFDIDLKSIGASGQPFEVFVAWTHYSTAYGAGLHQAYYQRSTVQSNITLIHTYFNQTSTNGGAWSVVWLTGTEIRVQKSAGTHGSIGHGYIRVTRLKP